MNLKSLISEIEQMSREEGQNSDNGWEGQSDRQERGKVKRNIISDNFISKVQTWQLFLNKDLRGSESSSRSVYNVKDWSISITSLEMYSIH